MKLSMMRVFATVRIRARLMLGVSVGVIAFGCAATAWTASQTWVAAPTDSNWTTAANWSGNAIPGANNARTTDVATFNNPIGGSGFGGAASPIVVDNLREINTITFDTNAGAYVFGPVGGTNQLSLTATSGT